MKKRLLLIALVISFGVHFVFIALSHQFFLSGMTKFKQEARALFKINAVEETAEAVRLFESPERKHETLKMSQPGTKSDLMELEKMIHDENVGTEIPLEGKKESLMEEEVDIDIQNKSEIDPEEIMRSETKKAQDEAAPEKRILTERRTTGTVITASSGSKKVSRVFSETSKKRSNETDVPWKKELIDTIKDNLIKPVGDIFVEKPKAVRIGKYEDIGSFLDVRLYAYKDQDTGDKYFKLAIKSRKDISLEVLPKEVIFLVDSSKSITSDKLEYIKEAVADSFKKMKEEDLFNVVAFKGELIKFKERSVAANNKNISLALNFIEDLEATGQTDVDNALLGIVKEQLAKDASYIILITDGRPSTGVTDSRKIIQEITRINNMERSIFSFAGGNRVNRYLLDFISYQNRGWSRFADRSYQMTKEFGIMYDQMRDPMLLNIRYRIGGCVEDKEVYPKYLPDFYQGKEFILYGKYEDDGTFFMQFLGETNGSTKELVFKRSFEKDAEQGSAEIAKEWAFRKIYDLISRDTMGEGNHDERMREVKVLSEKYGIKTPYDM
jgi:VWA domain-containing protein